LNACARPAFPIGPGYHGGKSRTDKVEIAVKDTGVGIAPEDQASLFEEFKQLGKDSSRKAEGTGLGLALTKRLVELHGGQIMVNSAVGHGSTFCVMLPVRRERVME
jgi:signal transduction histidine kinase